MAKMPDFTELFGIGGQSPAMKPDKNMGLALLLRFLADMIAGNEEETDNIHERPEVPVRPRVEPLGGS